MNVLGEEFRCDGSVRQPGPRKSYMVEVLPTYLFTGSVKDLTCTIQGIAEVKASSTCPVLAVEQRPSPELSPLPRNEQA